MFARMLSTDTIRAHAKSVAAFAVLLVFAVAALPALAQQQEQAATNVPAVPYGYGFPYMMWGGPGWGWHPFMVIGPIFVVLAIIGMMVIFVWLVRSGDPWLSVLWPRLPPWTWWVPLLRRSRPQPRRPRHS